MRRSRRSRAEEPLDAFVPEQIISAQGCADPEQEALVADAVGMALQVPDRRLALTAARSGR